MTAIQYLSAFRVYGADVLLLALGVTLVTSLLKKTVFKNLPNKVYVFLPFVVGGIFYAVYRALLTLSAAPFTSEIVATLEGGFACGCAATLYYVVYEQFFRTPSQSGNYLPPVAALLSGLVPEEEIPAAANELTSGAEERGKEELFDFVLATLREYCAQGDNSAPPSEAELYVYAKTVAEFLSVTKE